MSKANQPVASYMTTPVHSVKGGDSLDTAYERLVGLGISSLPVVDDTDMLDGVISMTDLLKIGRHRAGGQANSTLLHLPDAKVYEHMTSMAVTVSPSDPVSVAAARMVDGRIHRVYVTDGRKLAGVISTRDVMAAVGDKGMMSPIASWMSSPAFTIRVDETIAEATDRLRSAHVTGLIVVEDGWPVGLFTQEEALLSRDAPRDAEVESAMNSAMLVLDESTRLHRAAAQAAAMEARRVIAVRSRNVVGILTGFDFARAAL